MDICSIIGQYIKLIATMTVASFHTAAKPSLSTKFDSGSIAASMHAWKPSFTRLNMDCFYQEPVI